MAAVCQCKSKSKEINIPDEFNFFIHISKQDIVWVENILVPFFVFRLIPKADHLPHSACLISIIKYPEECFLQGYKSCSASFPCGTEFL